MCGIAGWLGGSADDRDAASLALALRHRGPDRHGIGSWPHATLVHTRLSILDLSPTGAQPMGNEDGTIWTVFNGEIYNHRDIRRQLESRGHALRGHSDTEILPHLYEEHGPKFVEKLRGMFAFALYDLKRRTLVIARDRFGVKPLFYAAQPERFAFASELTALLELTDIDTEPDRQAIFDFAALSYIPAPQTFYRGIRAVEPGACLELNLGANGRISSKTSRFHQWRIAVEPSPDRQMAIDRADALVQQAVGRQLESDVPLGSLLSGGIDSSLVSSAAQNALGGGLRTFNVQFDDADYDETWAARAVADHIGSQHETLQMDGKSGAWEHVTELLLHAGQPFADCSLFAVNAVCRLMRQRVAVALSGDGGDEAFGGYDVYWQMARILRFQNMPATLAAAFGPLSHLGVVSERLARRAAELKNADDTAIVQSLLCWLGPDEHLRLCRDTRMLPLRRWFSIEWEHHLPSSASRLERVSAHLTEVCSRLTMPNDFLFKVDIASMRESLEVRVPMLDEDLFAFGLSLPHSSKVSGRVCKTVLRSVAERRLPRRVAGKQKRGFAIPVDTWVDRDFKQALRDTVLGRGSRLDEFLWPEVYRPMVLAFCEDRAHPEISRQGLYQRAIMMLALHVNLDRARSRPSLAAAPPVVCSHVAR